jgi:hypothetical protein
MRGSVRVMVLGAAFLAVWLVYVLLDKGERSVSTTSRIPASHPTIRPPSRLTVRLSPRPAARALTNGPLAALTGASQGAANYLGRMAALQHLPMVLSTNDAEDLHVWLTTPYDPASGLSLREFNGLKNTAADLLLQQPRVPADLVADFAAMFLDSSYDSVWRDYCLQFLSAGHEKLAGRSDPEVAEARTAAVDTLRVATEQRIETFAGTALLGLEAISRREPTIVKPSEVATRAVAVAKDEQASEPCRITALRVAALTGASDVLPTARDLAQTGETEMLRQSAVATIGDLGTTVDQELLDALTHDSDKYVATIATKAADALRKRVAVSAKGAGEAEKSF